MIKSCIATVVRGSAPLWTVSPEVIEDDGTNHPDIQVIARDGITPTVKDKVLVSFMKNNTDMEPIPRYFPESEANGVIIGIMDTKTGYILTGDYTFIGDTLLDGNNKTTGDLLVLGNTTVQNLTVLGTLTAGAISAASIALPVGDVGALLLAYTTHKHAVTTAPGTTGGPI